MTWPIVTLTSDFGLEDPYVGQMKGAVLSVCPQANLVDLTHQIPPQDVAYGGYVVASSYQYFPRGTVHVAVVDPGVGTSRRPVVLSLDGHYFVAPDNGLLTPLLEKADREGGRVRVIIEMRYLAHEISPTFHGRDVFGPAAGHLAAGLEPRSLGPVITDPVRLTPDCPNRHGGAISGRVVRVDHFGNLITNISAEDIDAVHRPGAPEIRLGNQILSGLHLTYAEVPPGHALALIGSHGFLEISVNQGRADGLPGAGQGQEVIVSWPGGSNRAKLQGGKP